MKNEKLNLEQIRRIETQTTEGLKESIQDSDSPESSDKAFHDAVTKLNDGMDLYYLEIKNGSAIIRKRSDNSVVFMTDDSQEVEMLEIAGIEKNPKI